MASSSSTKITVMCAESKVLEVDEALVNASQTLKSLMKEKGIGGEKKINLPDISIEIMCKINEYVKKHAEAEADAKLAARTTFKERNESLDAWDKKFIQVDYETLCDILKAACYLKIENLEVLGCMTVANMIRGKSVGQIRQMLNIKNDFTPEEEEKMKEENPWAFEN